MSESGNTSREYKDRLFKFLFGNPDNKEWTLSLYNAMNGSNYTDPELIQINTIEDVVYMGMKNDVSFLIENTMNLYEQQSTFNPNMPMRFFIYAGMLYSKFIEGKKSYLRYSTVLQKAPTPKCICFYNGKTEKEDRLVLKLSDCFDKNVSSDIELKVMMININYGHNKELLNACKPLKEYSFFVAKARENTEQTGSLEQAIDAAISELPDDSIIRPFLIANKAEVKRMFITEYDEERARAELQAESYDVGKAEGKAETILSNIRTLIETLNFTAQQAMDALKVPEQERAQIEEQLAMKS